MRDDANAPEISLPLLERTARVLAMRRRVEDGYRRVMRMWADAGFTEGAVMRAIEALQADTSQDFEELKGAQALLQALRAPVQLELIKLHEARIPDTAANAHELAFDAGFYARFEGGARDPVIDGLRLTDQGERASWKQGFDEADALLAPAPAEPD